LARSGTHTWLPGGRCRRKCDGGCCHELNAAWRYAVDNWRSNGADPGTGIAAGGKRMDISPDREQHGGGRDDRSQDCRRLSSIPG
jgi:hypothetical protein